MTAVKAVKPGWSTSGFSQACRIRRCAVEEIGRNSVRPCTTPYSVACSTDTSALIERRDAARKLPAPVAAHVAAPDSRSASAAVRRLVNRSSRVLA